MTTYRRSIDLAVTALVLVLLAGWGFLHYAALGHVSILHSPRELVYLCAFSMIAWQTVLLACQSRYTATAGQQRALDELKVVVPVPVRNEDPGILRRVLEGLLTQTRMPDIIHVVDNDSDDPRADYTTVKSWFLERCTELGVQSCWDEVSWRGKRRVHGHVARMWGGVGDIYLTVDSDGILSPNAIHELLLPFTRPNVHAVAGIVLADNANANLMARILDLWFVSTQLVGRASQGALGAVTVCSGPLAAYRMGVVADNLEGYLNETFFGRPVHFSDDSMLTLYALMRGKVVQNPHAIVLAAMPEDFSHHARQYLRWMRGSTIRTIWRLRYLRLSSYAYWVNLLNWTQMLASIAVLADLFGVWPAEGRGVPWRESGLIAIALGYLFTARYLAIRRSDENYAQRVANWLLAPMAVAWSYTVLRGMRWYGASTCLNTDWGTRAQIEVFQSVATQVIVEGVTP